MAYLLSSTHCISSPTVFSVHAGPPGISQTIYQCVSPCLSLRASSAHLFRKSECLHPHPLSPALLCSSFCLFYIWHHVLVSTPWTHLRGHNNLPKIFPVAFKLLFKVKVTSSAIVIFKDNINWCSFTKASLKLLMVQSLCIRNLDFVLSR